MRIIKESIILDWDGPLSRVIDLPGAVLYGAVLTVVHTARFVPWESVRAHLKEAFGPPTRESKRWRSVSLTWEAGKLPATVQVRKDRIRVRLHGRLSPARLRRLVRALQEVPNTGSVRLSGQVQRFRDDSGDVVPMG